jgi:phosphoribosylanthranilate isomerase
MTYVKICGITNQEDALAAAEAGADLLGFIFYPPSPRYLTPERAAKIVQVLHRGHPATKTVGVFVDESIERVRTIMDECELDLVQLHGAETPEMVRGFSPRVYKSLRPRDAVDALGLLEIYRRMMNGNRPAFIVDAFTPNLYGGTGARADWALAKGIAREFPILLAGGLAPENVCAAIAEVQPWGVDVSTGVERAPGLKDHAKVRRFIELAKSAIGVTI